MSLPKDRRFIILLSLLAGMFMSAIEGTIVATAIPDIVGDLGGFSLYSWVFSSYLLMNALTILIYGKLADLFGRKPIYIFGVIVFLVGSLFAGFATSMMWLVVFRFIQGFGAGAVQPTALTIVGDLYKGEERGKVQGYLSSVWGISAIIGPALGGFFVDVWSWSWVFWMNIPLGILSLIGIGLFFKESSKGEKRKIDFPGASLLFVAVLAIMVVLIQGGIVWPWLSLQIVGLVLLAFLCLTVFIWQERRAENPIVPLEIWKNPLIALANTVSLTTGVIIIGLASFLPAFVQAVMGKSALVAGFTLTAMSIGWPISSTITGRVLMKYGYRKLSLVGGFSLIIGGLFFVTLGQDNSPLWAAFGSFFVGVGMGTTSTSFIVSIQNSVRWDLRGAATSSTMFMRMLGGATGAALLGSILNSRLRHFINSHDTSQAVSIESANALLNGSQGVQLSSAARQTLSDGLAISLHTVYITIFGFAIISCALIAFMPKRSSKQNQTSRTS